MSFAESYIQKHLFLMPQIKTPPSRGLSYVVVIPAYLEDAIDRTLQSIKNTTDVEGDIEVLVVVNYSQTDTDKNKTINKNQYKHLHTRSEEYSRDGLRFYPILAADLPEKHAGAGLARKIGMDEALHRFGLINNARGIILSLDADTPVERSYFTSIEKEFYSEPNYDGCILPFAHPVEGSEFSGDIYNAITLYELHLRYYRHALKFSGFPYSYYTIGSCFGVRAEFYVQQGGMNRRKAGEDFYFLNKLFPHRNFKEIIGTIVYPSPRASFRVPFGTGPAIQQLVCSEKMKYMTYNLQAFIDLKILFEIVSELYVMTENICKKYMEQLPQPLSLFLASNNFLEKIKEIRKNTASESAFYKRFFLWFDGFKVVKFLNFSHEKHYSRIDVTAAADMLLSMMEEKNSKQDALSLLKCFRNLDYHVFN